ncbi:ATP-binding protein [Sinorhizobium sp. 8-89]|uniref:sensor histidine kinase n=1 Tax=Sinorhizobium sp. 7-81 TaxID=3049087 RepID=UPI0024C2D9C6|nr:ATP-binding protein [Sinorhizobium sp. 7-81]MDK1386538.1 ATP-binding protein [Sinorhizobium sp. 7-81]
MKNGLAGQELAQELRTALFALPLSGVVFYIDAFTTIESAIAVLYVVALLLAAPVLSRAGTIAAASICGLLAFLAFAIGHSNSIDFASSLRLVVSLAALSITCALILRNDTAHNQLIQANSALSESESRYRSIFEESRVALWERDYSLVREFLVSLKAAGVRDFRTHASAHPDVMAEAVSRIRTIAANDAARELIGLPPGEQIPASLQSLVPANMESMAEILDCVFRGRNRFEGKCRIVRYDGSEREVLLSLRFPDDPAAFRRVAVAMFDITHREKTHRALRDAQAELTNAARAATMGAMSASLAHELNQPLGALVVNAQTLVRWLDKDPPDLVAVRGSAERMIRDSQRASDIILNTRNFIKQERRKFEDVSVPDLVEETRALMDHELQRDAVQLTLDVEDSLPTVHAVRIELQQVLINLISNSIHAVAGIPESDRLIQLSLSRKSHEALSLKVRDFGPGMSDGIREKLFAPFFTTKPDGMGIGLSISRATMEGMGGSLTGMNATTGAVFEMTVPLRATQ